MGWAFEELEDMDLGDKRLNTRAMKLCDKLSEAPESPINQACEDWTETKAAYRFFQNDNVAVERIMSAHRNKTASRVATGDTVLALQDTSYIIYTRHPKTRGLGDISLKKGKNIDKITSRGLVMHTCLAVTTEGKPLGLLDQAIFARKLRPENQRRSKGGKYVQDSLPVEEKESYRWIAALEKTTAACRGNSVVTVCDRECDFYDFFKAAAELDASVLIRASQNRTVDRNSRYAEKDVSKLWDHMSAQPELGEFSVEVCAVPKTRHCKGRTARTAMMTVKVAPFTMNPPRNNPKHGSGLLPNIPMYAIHVLEREPPENEDPVEWMLLTNIPVTDLRSARQKVRWYSLRWRIEMYFKVLKSGFRVEACRLQTADRLIRYLMVMSIIAWRLFMITLIARTEAAVPCTNLLAELEWKVLVLKGGRSHRKQIAPPTTAEAVVLIAQLGGYLARKSDGPPGTLVLWRGWKRLMDLVEGYDIATSNKTCG